MKCVSGMGGGCIVYRLPQLRAVLQCGPGNVPRELLVMLGIYIIAPGDIHCLKLHACGRVGSNIRISMPAGPCIVLWSSDSVSHSD